MKKLLISSLFAVLITLLYTSQSYSQFRMSVGPEMGMNFNLHTGSDLSESGTGIGFVIGGQVDMDFTQTIGLVTSMQFYDNRSGSTTQESSQQYQDNQGNPVTSTISRENSASLAYFMIEPLFKLRLPGSGFYFLAGPSIGFNIEGTGEVEATETLPPPYTWDGQSNKRTLAKSKGSMKDLLARFELKFGSGYNIPVSNSIYLYPQLTFGYGITKVQSDLSWRILTIQALFGVKFRLI